MSVALELIQNGNILPSYQHDGKYFVEAPPSGNYTIRLRNTTPGKKLCVVSVDGRNVVDGTLASFKGSGYVLMPFRTIEIPGWQRTNSEVAAFEFKPNEKSYAKAIGDGTSNTGVIGLAVFDEKEKPIPLQMHYIQDQPSPWKAPNPFYFGPQCSESDKLLGFQREHGEITPCHDSAPVEAVAPIRAESVCSFSAEELTKTGGNLRERSVLRGAKSVLSGVEPMRSVEDLGTGYGQKLTMYTSETTFDRASENPSFLLQVQYAMRERLIEWGVPVAKPAPSPSAFPAQPSPRISVRAPDGWKG